ncbi:MAG: DUF1801 domain-containing protein [Chloroflexota bacterium]
MAENKTSRNDGDVLAFLNGVENVKRKADAFEVLKIMEEETGESPEMWGASLVGFGSYDYKYASGRAGSWFLTGFSPRKANMTLYIMPGFERYDDLLGKLGKHKLGKSCLYVNKLEDVDLNVLRELVRLSAEQMRNKNN